MSEPSATGTDGGPFPLTPLQQAMLLRTLADPDGIDYTQQYILDIVGPLDALALSKAWQDLADRHPALHTAFAWRGLETPEQVVRPGAAILWEHRDWRGLDPGEAASEMQAFLEADLARGFRLDEPPLVRLSLIRSGDSRHTLVWTAHHATLDGQSRALLIQELRALYASRLDGTRPDLPPVTPFREYAEWLARLDHSASAAFWRDLLDGHDEPTTLELPGTSATPSARSVPPRRHPIPADVSARLRERAEALGVTLNTLFQGAWAILLSRYVGRPRVTFGAVRSARDVGSGRFARVVGPLINTLPVPVDVDPSAPLCDWLKRLRALWVDLRPHAHTPTSVIRQASPVPAGMMIFDTVLAFGAPRTPRPVLAGADLLPTSRAELRARSSYPLAVRVDDREAIVVGAEYDPRRFSGEEIDRLLGHYAHVLSELATAPAGSRVGDLRLMDPAEERRVLTRWARPRLEPLRGPLAHEAIEEHRRRTPGAVALTRGDERVTYDELGERSDRVARRLRRAGVRQGSIVAVCAGRTTACVAAILGVLKAGAAYLPLDPQAPPDRLTFILGDAKAGWLLTGPEAANLAGRVDPSVLVMDLEGDDDDTCSDAVTFPSVSPCDLAYVLYTSGTTGWPKGVEIEHQGLASLVEFSLRRLPRGQRAGMLASSSFAFDFSVFDLFVGLGGGTTVILADDLFALSTPPASTPVTLVTAVPSVMSAYLADHRLPPSVSAVVLGGEALEARLARACHDHGTVEDVYNLYGPVEATVFSALARVDPDDDPPPVGGPVDHARLYVLDDAMRPVPEGVAGELWIGGRGLARGYVGRPDLTALAFRPDPFLPNEPNARVYRTGDLVRARPDGRLVFLGRRDQQVKVRGVRIELGEIESALARHPRVREAAATALTCKPGGVRLAAYVVPRAGLGVRAEELRDHLRAFLPDAMIPSAFVVLDRLPRTAGGKVDRKALPCPSEEEVRPDDEYEAPSDPLEGAMAEIWAGVLGCERVGIHDHFFEQGGHSLAAMRVVARVRDALGITLPMRALFDTPTVAGLVRRIRSARQENQGADAPPILRTESGGRSPLSFAQQRLWFLDRLEPGTAAYNIPRVFQIVGSIDVDTMGRALGALLRRHDVLRTTFEDHEGEPAAVVRPDLKITLDLDDLRGAPEAERAETLARRAEDEATRPFNLAADPMIRARLVQTSGREHTLFVTVHHIAADGWSLNLLWRELGELYEAEAAGQTATLAPLPVRYADYAAWQKSWLQGEALERQLGYWRTQLTGLTPLDLPADRPRPPAMSYRGAACEFHVDADLLDRLRELGRHVGATLHMTLLSAFCVLLHRYAGQDDFAVAVPSANRTNPEIQGLVGFFVNTLVLRADLAGRPTFRDLLGRVRRVAVESYDHAEVPFETLVAELSPTREEGRNPLAQVLFQLLDAPPAGLSLAGVETTPLPDPCRRVRFDLELHLRPRADGPGLCGWLLYSTDLFDASTIERMLGHYLNLLESLPRAADEPVARLPMMGETERRQVLLDWGGAGDPLPAALDFMAMFREQAARTPHAAAILDGDRSVSYAELDARSDRLARRLRRLGVGPDVPAALLAGRSPGLLAGVLGVLKAGGAYVPLDPDSPAVRLKLLIADVNPAVLLADSRRAGVLAESSIPVVPLDGPEPPDDAGPLPPAGGDALAYVLYTSGSTGTPKGVAMTRAPLGNLIAWQRRESAAGPGARTLQYAPMSFDVSFQECFATWCAGGTLVLISDEDRRDPLALLGLLNEARVERLFLPFVALRELAESVRITGVVPGSLKEVITAGEALQVTPAIRELFDRLPGCVLVNQYGPTETHVATAYRLTGPPGTWPELPPIGRPIDGARVYVLDDECRPVPAGVPGEVFLGGLTPARGYHNRPEQTAERFLPDPFDHESGLRVYQSGDLARWRPDGNLEFLGRRDHQVKLRGFRIEPAEVETALARHPAVEGCKVVVRDEPAGGRRLVAYWTARPNGSSASDRDLKEHLSALLPEYMVPSAFVRLDAFPRNAHGKVDRLALPAPSPAERCRGTNGLAPRTDLERALATHWAEVLGVDHVGVHDDFFDLGGHSLLAMRLVARVSAVMGRPVGIKLLFRHATVARLAEAIEAEAPAPGPAARPAPPAARVPELSPLLTWERRSLLELIACGALPPVDSAALGYLPDELTAETGLSSEQILDDWYEGLPHLSTILETAHGRIGLIHLPRFASDVYDDPAGLRAEIALARALAGRVGARAVSLTGLIPSATGYARDLNSDADSSLPPITTGHATTVAAVLLSVAKALRLAGRDLKAERAGVLGLGSIGSATLRLMLQALPHPPELVLCDLYGKLDRDALSRMLGECSYRGKVRYLESRPGVPEEFYECSLVVGATNVPDVLDVGRLRPGTIVVDDSGPHCFSAAEALRRVESKHDILVTEGGVLLSPEPVARRRHVPRKWEPHLGGGLGRRLAHAHPRRITGCILSGLLTATYPEAAVTVGRVRPEDGLTHYRRLVALGFDAAGPLVSEREISEAELAGFRQTSGIRGDA